MRKSWKAWCGAAALLLTLPSLQAAAQQTVKEAEKDTSDKAAFFKLIRPEAEMAILDRFVGTWEGTFKVMLHGTPPVEATMKDRLDTKWILNNSFIETSFAGQFNENKMVGRVTMGYNGGRKHFYRFYQADWDPRGTYSVGHYIRSRNALVFKGPEDDPLTGDSFEKRDSFTFVDKDKIYYEQFYTFADGSEVRVMEGYYNRVPAK
jgi:hypothetical protein